MDTPDLQARLTAFCRAMLDDTGATASDVEVLPGHAGFSWGFRLRHGDGEERLVLRLPPPNVRWTGPADVVRQARIMQALATTAVPVPAVRWTGDDPRWFERPYIVVARLPGDTIRFRTDAGTPIPHAAAELESAARQVTAALAALHRLPWQRVMPDWPAPLPLAEEVRRWEWLHERSADPALTALAPVVRDRLLARVPPMRRQAIVHGDYQWSNHLFHQGRLLAVLDWELSGTGETRMDLGWLAVFSDRASWTGFGLWESPLPDAEAIVALYEEAMTEPARDVAWFRALAGYKFALITGLNLGLHRRGRRIDPQWEDLAPSAPVLLERALALLG